MLETADALKNVFWLGGSPCAGKSSISEALANRFKGGVYHIDEAFEIHRQNLNPAHQPTLTRWLASSWNERWMQPIESLLEEVIACYREQFDLILEDILAITPDSSLLVEGSALLPRLVADILTNRNHAIWVIPTADFQRKFYSARAWARGIVAQCENPEAAFQNWMDRDIRFAKWIEADVNALDLELFKIDGSRTIAESVEEVAHHFQLATD
jgi:2-phosphoglycerate kinase